jgi:hydroxymethylpyrimidine/phosphomethylpyrimidine kinase
VRAVLVDTGGVALARALTIAGSDSGGGAGIQADLKAFARCGVYGTVAITAVTAQNTRGISAIHVVPPAIVRAQIEAVVDDIGVDAVKVGMLATAATIEAVAATLRARLPGVAVVLDPVLTASAGGELLDPDAVVTLIRELVPLATVLTPNLPEARALLAAAGRRFEQLADDLELARALLDLGPGAVVITGGHRSTPRDIYADQEGVRELEGARYDTQAVHGSGCTHSAVLAAELARGSSALQAAATAAALAAEAIRSGIDELGHGPGPVDILAVRRRRAPFDAD